MTLDILMFLLCLHYLMRLSANFQVVFWTCIWSLSLFVFQSHKTFHVEDATRTQHSFLLSWIGNTGCLYRNQMRELMVEVEGDQVILSTYPETADLSTMNIVEGNERMWSSSVCVDNSTRHSEDVSLVSCTQFTQRCCLPQYSIGSLPWRRWTYVSVSPGFRTQIDVGWSRTCVHMQNKENW